MQNLSMDDWSRGDFSFVRGSCIFDGLIEPRESALNSLKYIYTDITDIKKNYIRLGFHLNEFQVGNYYLDFGFRSIAEMAEANFGMDKGAVSRCIDVFRRFCMKQEYSCKMVIDDRYKDFSYSQLVEMLPLKDDIICKITPDMSVRQIRELKKKESNKKVATSQLLVHSYSSDDLIVINCLFDTVFRFLGYDGGFHPCELSRTAKRSVFELSDGNVLTVSLSFSKSDRSK